MAGYKVPRITVTYRNLKKERALGQALKSGTGYTGKVEICTSVKGVDKIDTLIHECLHIIFPDITEEKINESATIIAKVLWKEKYRCTD